MNLIFVFFYVLYFLVFTLENLGNFEKKNMYKLVQENVTL